MSKTCFKTALQNWFAKPCMSSKYEWCYTQNLDKFFRIFAECVFTHNRANFQYVLMRIFKINSQILIVIQNEKSIALGGWMGGWVGH
jgi:hypothetical protein